jgi:hypothetical protein
MGRRAFPRRVLLGILSGLVLLIVAAWIWVNSVEQRLREKVKARVLELNEELAKRNLERPALFGEPVPGNAWDDYLIAIDQLSKLPPASTSILFDYAQLRRGHDAEQARALLPGFAPILEALKVGARRAYARKPVYEDDRRSTRQAIVNHHMKYLPWVAICAAKIYCEDGNALEGAQLLLATAQFGRDRQDRFPLRMPMEEAARQLQAGRLSGEALRVFVSGLEILDGSFPQFEVRLMIRGWGERVLAGHPGNTSPNCSPSPSWKQAYSGAILELQGFLNVDRWLQAGAVAEGLSWSEARVIWDQIERESWTAGNSASQGIPFIYEAPRDYRDNRAWLRLLRMGATYAASGDIIPLPDPYGDLLLSMALGTELKIWSLARNGVDDGGTWAPSNDKDIVIRLPKYSKR